MVELDQRLMTRPIPTIINVSDRPQQSPTNADATVSVRSTISAATTGIAILYQIYVSTITDGVMTTDTVWFGSAVTDVTDWSSWSSTWPIVWPLWLNECRHSCSVRSAISVTSCSSFRPSPTSSIYLSPHLHNHCWCGSYDTMKYFFIHWIHDY